MTKKMLTSHNIMSLSKQELLEIPRLHFMKEPANNILQEKNSNIFTTYKPVPVSSHGGTIRQDNIIHKGRDTCEQNTLDMLMEEVARLKRENDQLKVRNIKIEARGSSSKKNTLINRSAYYTS